MSEWYTKGLLAYMLGLGEEEIEELMNKYLEEVGVEDPRTLLLFNEEVQRICSIVGFIIIF